MNDIDRQIESINIATKALKVQFGKYYELGALTNSIPLLEELRVLRNAKGKAPIVTIKFSKKELQEIVDEKIEMFQTDIQVTRNKAIDEFAEKITFEISESIIWGMISDNEPDVSEKIFDYVTDTVKKIAEQMKGGGKDA